MTPFTARAEAIALRTYHRPKNNGELETWPEVVNRVIEHQRWLWERALGRTLQNHETSELNELKNLILNRRALPAGRTLWLGGTELSQKRESSMFNCAFTNVETVYDVVDLFWLLLQGSGVGFHPVIGTLNGFRNPLDEIEVIRSQRTDIGGDEKNQEFYDPETGIWKIVVGDTAYAWAKAVGKLVAGKYPAKKLILDFSNIRPAGTRLSGYGWISSGDGPISEAFQKIAKILSDRSDQLLTRIDILDIVNLLGTVLASRRSAQMAIFEYGEPEWDEFASAKKSWWITGQAHRQQSNNSLLFHTKPSRKELEHLFHLILDGGGSEPGLINAQAALTRAPWFKGCNPCGEILLGNKSFCNLTEVNLLAFTNHADLLRAIRLVARMNYRQTMVDLHDEILQEAWHLNNQFLHLCGVSLTGIRAKSDLNFVEMKNTAVNAANEMAQELNAPLPKNVTCIKPSGTLSKIMGSPTYGEVPEGIHMPLGKYIFNQITFSKYDPLIDRFKAAGYEVIEKPFEPVSVLINFPILYKNVPFTRRNNVDINDESAIKQLEWYTFLQRTYSQQNVSVTISYSPEEIPDMINWLDQNWDAYVGVSFLLRNDPTKRPKDLGFAYLPQQVVSQETFEKYSSKLKPVDFSGLATLEHQMPPEACEGPVC